MVSALFKACSEGDFNTVVALLENSSSSDIEFKDHTGITPLIQAVQNGHVEIVRILLDKGADPNNPSSQGRPVQYTSDQLIQELLVSASQNGANGVQHPPPADYSQDGVQDPSHAYYPPPPGTYYYPPPPPPLFRDGALHYYPPQSSPPVPGEQPSNGIGNLPPPEIARLIPCRYFPACRYGASCMFAHPQGQYVSGPIAPPAQYPLPYDSMSAPYPQHNYYAGSSPSFPTQNTAMDPMSPHAAPIPTPPHAPVMHGRNGSEVISPVTHFSPHGPVPVPFNAPPVSPIAYPPHSSQVPGPAPLPPLQHTMPPLPPHGSQQGPPHMYPISPPQGPMPSFPISREGPYPPHMPIDPKTSQKSPPLHPQADSYVNGPPSREGMNWRRGTMRKQSSASRKPPCLFFPSGRCRNGPECRFPHIIPDTNGPPSGRIGSKPRYPLNGVTNLENNIARMSLNDDGNSPRTHPSTEASSRSHSTDDMQARGQGPRSNNYVNGSTKKHVIKTQRVPTSDEFPSLGGGSTTSPSRSPGPQLSNGHTGLTAAQVLQAPPPSRKDSARESRVTSPEHSGNSSDSYKDSKSVVEINAKTSVASEPSTLDKVPLSFAAATTGSVDAGKQLTVSA